MLDDLLKTATVRSRVPANVRDAARAGRLNAVVSARLRGEGEKLSSAFIPEDAIRILGKRIYLKNAEWTLVRNGLDALKG
jgi:hypothetical protein